MSFKIFLTTVSGLFLFSTALAADMPPQIDDPSERAKLRLYPGGIDEEDLKVQEKLPIALRKVSKKIIQKEVFKEALEPEEGEDSE